MKLEDTINYLGGNDLIAGNQGDDLITVGDGSNAVFGDTDRDTIRAGAGPNVLLGNEGDDVITAGSGMNTVFGGMDNDLITVGDGGDLLFGGEGKRVAVRQHAAETTMSDRLTPAQVRAARAVLDWSMFDLARAARVSMSTVKRFEGEGDQPVSPGTVAMMQDALESAGVSFLADDGSGPGIRLRRR